MKIDTGIASTIPILSTKKRHNSHGICNFTMVTKRTSLFIRIKHVGIRPQPNTNNSTLIIVPIMSYPISLPDLNNSKIIEKNEALYLAFALSLDSICVGITSSSFGMYSLLFPILVPLFQFIFLNAGIILGKKIVLYNTSLKKWNIISGVLLIVIGILRGIGT